MSGLMRLAVFAVLLVAVFGGAALVGNATNPSRSAADAPRNSALEPADGGHADPGDAHTDEPRSAAGDEHGDETGGEASNAPLPGLQVADHGYRLVVARSTFARPADDQRFSFRIVDARGDTVRDFAVAHDEKMHFIVVRRDTAGFQHLHPTMEADGTWTSRVDFGEAGTYRLFADFNREGEQRTLGVDVHVGGTHRPQELPSPTRIVRSDRGLEVTLESDRATAGREAGVGFEVRNQDGEMINDDLQPYLGAKGHLVTLRAGDLAYLHTHPEGDELAFATTYPSAGAYRMFVQFRYENQVHTASFTYAVRH